MKLHRPVLKNVITALEHTFRDGFYADKVLERLFKSQSQLGSRDRRFIAESFYDIVRWWRRLWAALDHSEPDLFAVNVNLPADQLWHVLGAWLVLKGETLPGWPEFAGLSPDKIQRKVQLADENPAIRESLPDWLYELGKKELGANWDSITRELNREAPVVLRANRLRNTRDELRKTLAAEEIETRPAPATDDGLILIERRNVFSSKAFQSGLFEVQDGASQQVAPLLDVQPGQRVIDACAGAGGKTLHVAAMMGNKGKIIAMDLFEKKLEQLRKRCTRNGVDIVEVRKIEGAKTVKRLENSVDRVLLDVPCSGLGVLRRNPDSKWKLKPESLENLRLTQAEILHHYTAMVKKGGLVVYATCSVLPSENGQQVESFLLAHGDRFRLISEKSFMPGQDGYDGFYAALLERI
jgi:16S rRNA (cytosine967-C5)-methyltransferase